MDIRNEKNHVFNIKLAKFIGLYQILDPETAKCCGRNIYHIATGCVLLYLSFISMILIFSCLYYWSVNITVSMDYFWKLVSTIYTLYKMWAIVSYSNDIWNCMSIMRYDFISNTDQNRHILDRWRERLVWLTNTYAIMYCASLLIYLIFTLAFGKDKSPFKNHDGSIGYYRQNAMNLYLIVSDETYNDTYYIFYIVEGLYCAFVGIFLLIFDILLVTLCFSICCQMEIICSAFESVGHKSLRDPHTKIDYSDENVNISPIEHNLIYDELKTIIMDHQAVMAKYEDFLTLFRRVVLLHIFVSSLLVIAIWFTVLMSFSDNDRFKTSDVVVKQMFCVIPLILFQIFMVCYLFGNVQNQNESTVFALYSSNWTEMDMKCKKLILLTMKLNNANHKTLKFTRTKIVNLEMFLKTMGNCYTVISVLVNYMGTSRE